MNNYLQKWDVENEQFWESEGKSVANRNLWLSIPSLSCAFAIWAYWSIITVQMKNLGYPYDTAQLLTLTAIAGLAGATMRIPNSFLIAIAGGRNVVAFTTGLLIIPALGTGIALQSQTTPYWVFAVLAALSGIGGGNFASSMSNINFFFPKRGLGMALGLNAGVGNLGVSIMQILLPFVMTFGLFGPLGGAGVPLPKAVGAQPAGTLIYIQNAGLVWVPILLILTVAAWFGMTNLTRATPREEPTSSALFKTTALLLVGYAGNAVGLYLLIGMGLNMWLVLPITILLTLGLMKLIPGDIQPNLTKQFAIFNNKHNWIMTYLYIMTFGSFIGYSNVFPILIRVIFGQLPDGSINPHGPNPFAYAWLGPLVGSVARPIGGWLSDKMSGAKVTQWSTAVMVLAALGSAYFIKQAGGSPQPEQYFTPFLILFLILFITAGIGNGSTFRMVPMIFSPAEAGPVLGWTSAIAAYGAFVIPKVFGAQVEAKTPEYALYGFAFYYLTCLVLNWYYYARKGAEIEC